MMRLAALLIPLLLLAQPAHAQRDLVRATLLADTETIQPGQPFRLGVMLDIEPGWHIYWRNPGDGGVSTEVELMLPQGFTAGDLRYPLPQRFVQPGQITGYGYKRQAMLIVEIAPPSDLIVGSHVPVELVVNWLSCDPTVCIPGSKKLNMTLPVSDQPQPANKEIFDLWTQQLPSQWTGEPIQAQVQSADDGRSAIVTAALPDVAATMRDIELFLDPPPTLLVDQTELIQDGMKMRVRPAPKTAIPLPILITYTDPDNRRRGIELPLHLPAEAQQQKSP